MVMWLVPVREAVGERVAFGERWRGGLGREGRVLVLGGLVVIGVGWRGGERRWLWGLVRGLTGSGLGGWG